MAASSSAGPGRSAPGRPATSWPTPAPTPCWSTTPTASARPPSWRRWATGPQAADEPDPADGRPRAAGLARRRGRWRWRAAPWPPGGTSCRWPTAWSPSRRCSTCTPRRASAGWSWRSGAGFGPGLSCVLARHAAGDARRGRRGPRRPPRHRGPGVRPAAPRGAAQRGARLARPRLAPPPAGLGPRAVLLPRSDRGLRLLPGGPARRVAAGAGVPVGEPGHGPAGRDPPRPVHGRPADAAPAARRGPHRRPAGRGAGPARPGPRHGRARRGRPSRGGGGHRGGGDGPLGGLRPGAGDRSRGAGDAWSSRCRSCRSWPAPACGPRCSRAPDLRWAVVRPRMRGRTAAPAAGRPAARVTRRAPPPHPRAVRLDPARLARGLRRRRRRRRRVGPVVRGRRPGRPAAAS